MSTRCFVLGVHGPHEWWIEASPGESGPDKFWCDGFDPARDPHVTFSGGWCAPAGMVYFPEELPDRAPDGNDPFLADLAMALATPIPPLTPTGDEHVTAQPEFPPGASFYYGHEGAVWMRWPNPEGGVDVQSLQAWVDDNCPPGWDTDVTEVRNEAGAVCILTVELQGPPVHPIGSVQARRFRVVRHKDPSGVSGTGVIAHGVQMPDGAIAMRWSVPDMPPTWNLLDRIEDLEQLHGHNGATEVEWID